jgi:hypothetical protein
MSGFSVSVYRGAIYDEMQALTLAMIEADGIDPWALELSPGKRSCMASSIEMGHVSLQTSLN